MIIKNKTKTLLSKYKSDLIAILLSTMFIIVFFIYIYDLKNADMSLPLNHSSGDALFLQSLIKSMQENGWINSNPLMGAPFERNLYDFPFFSDNFNLFITKIILIFTNNWVSALNINFFLLFILTFLSSYYVFRKLKINILISSFSSILFTFLPYRFDRHMSHFHLNCYYLIPFIVLFLIQFYNDENFLNFKYSKKEKHRTIFVSVTLFLFAISGIYYAFFACYFIVIIVIKRLIRDKNKEITLLTIFKSGYMLGIIGVSLLINYIPNLIYQITNGQSFLKPTRIPYESELYALKISDLLIPSYKNKLFPFFGNLIENKAHLDKAEHAAFLGIVGVIGFLILLLILLWVQKEKDLSEPKQTLLSNLHFLSQINIFAILLSTIGGFSVIFALTISPSIRAYNRISPYIAFFSILAVAYILTYVINSIAVSKKKIIIVFSILLYSFSLLSQSNKFNMKQVQPVMEISSNKEFVEYIESQLEPGAMILQYPYMQFPEVPPVNNLGDYQLSKGYMYSSTLRWSYGGYKGRESDSLLSELNALPLPQQLVQASIIGFTGIYIDTRGYTLEELSTFCNEIESITDSKKHVSYDGMLFFYDISKFSAKTLAELGPDEVEKQYHEIMTIIPAYSAGFQPMSMTIDDETCRWSNNRNTINFMNTSDVDINVDIRFKLSPQAESDATIILNEETYHYLLQTDGEYITLNSTLHPGQNLLYFDFENEENEFLFSIIDIQIIYV